MAMQNWLVSRKHHAKRLAEQPYLDVVRVGQALELRDQGIETASRGLPKADSPAPDANEQGIRSFLECIRDHLLRAAETDLGRLERLLRQLGDELADGRHRMREVDAEIRQQERAIQLRHQAELAGLSDDPEDPEPGLRLTLRRWAILVAASSGLGHPLGWWLSAGASPGFLDTTGLLLFGLLVPVAAFLLTLAADFSLGEQRPFFRRLAAGLSGWGALPVGIVGCWLLPISGWIGLFAAVGGIAVAVYYLTLDQRIGAARAAAAARLDAAREGLEQHHQDELSAAAGQWAHLPAECYRAYCADIRRFAEALSDKERTLASFARQVASLNRAHLYCLRLYRDTIETLRLSEMMPWYWRTFELDPFTAAAVDGYQDSLGGQQQLYQVLQEQVRFAFDERLRLEDELQNRYQPE